MLICREISASLPLGQKRAQSDFQGADRGFPSSALLKRFCAMPHAWRAGSRGWCGPQPAGRGLGPLTLTAMHTLTARGRGLVYLPCLRRLASERTSPLRGRVSGWYCRSVPLRWLLFKAQPVGLPSPIDRFSWLFRRAGACCSLRRLLSLGGLVLSPPLGGVE